MERTCAECYNSDMIRSARFALIGGVMCAGCESVTAPPRDDSPTQTDRTVYVLQRYNNASLSSAIATYVNRTGHSVYYQRCTIEDPNPMYGLRRTGPDSSRSLVTDLAWGCVGGVPTGVIASAESVTIRIRLGSLDEPNMKPEDITGTMRVVLELCGDYRANSDPCVQLPLAERQSNAFVVRY